MLKKFFVCFRSFTGQKLFASSLLCCSIFTLVVVRAIQRITLFFLSAVM